jgi:hypothetical protein
MVGWRFKISSGTQGDKTVVKLFKNFLQMGLYSKLHQDEKIREINSQSRVTITNNIIQGLHENEGNKLRRNKERPLKLGDSIQTIFIILVAMLFISLCCFLLEILLMFQ